ncbi:DUF6232 family protein [Plantactinospora endophytica]|uniref:Uncharacterized protein n=1 Tax=Plantactinospora endophytica TaxID=673535 RepID=A0ABQ4DV74_9ACTN|nr:DUF6232 family protein [Plantactinospora endophytica]GIG86347.1 hypothetical protein Pen02_12830 [Plantactinospora endophytica]
MTLYYRDDTVRVTSETIHVNGRSVPVAEVSYVWHAKGRGTARTRGRLAGRGVLIFLLSIPPLVAMVCVLSLAYSAQDRGEWRLALIVLAVCVVGALALFPFLEIPLHWLDRSYERGAKVQELWVQYRGEEALLLRSSDALRFGQIYRAIQRAIEQHSPEE